MKRLSYLDGLRSFAMAFGLLVHAGVVSPGASNAAVSFISQNFRMAIFFAISGFFAAMMVEKRGAGPFVRWRLPVLIAPLVVGLALLNPITHYLIHLYNGGEGGFLDLVLGRVASRVGPLQNWHLHLWFLITLSIYVICAPALLRLVSASWVKSAIGALAARPAVLVPVLALGFAVFEVAARGALKFSLGSIDGMSERLFVPRATLAYMPYFILGIAMFVVRPLFEAMHRYCWWALIAGLGLGAALAIAPEAVPGVAGRTTEIGLRALATVAAIAALLRLFRSLIRSGNRFAEALNRSVYTVYMVHYLVIYALALTVFAHVATPLILHFGLAAAAFAIGTLLHFRVVERVPALEFLLNGRIRPRHAAGAGYAGAEPKHRWIRSRRGFAQTRASRRSSQGGGSPHK